MAEERKSEPLNKELSLGKDNKELLWFYILRQWSKLLIKSQGLVFFLFQHNNGLFLKERKTKTAIKTKQKTPQKQSVNRSCLKLILPVIFGEYV